MMARLLMPRVKDNVSLWHVGGRYGHPYKLPPCRSETVHSAFDGHSSHSAC